MKTHYNAISNLGKTVLLVLAIFLSAAGIATGATIYEETFETDWSEWQATINPGGEDGTIWQIDDDKNHTLDPNANQSANCADNGAYLPNTDASIKTTINLANYVNARLSFWIFYDGELTFDYGQVIINNEVVAPTIDVEGFTGYACRDDCPPDWIKREVDISDYNQQVITLEFRYRSDGEFQGDGDGPWDGFYIDDIKITGDYTETAPDAPVIDTAIDPNDGPQDGAKNVSLDTDLNWTNPGAGINTHDVEVLMNVNLNPPTTVVRPFSSSVVDLLNNGVIGGPLSGSSTYYWKVSTKNTSSGETASKICRSKRSAL